MVEFVVSFSDSRPDSMTAEQTMTYAAVETLARLAVGAPQLYESLRDKRIAARQSTFNKQRHDTVLFGRKLLKQPQSMVLQ